MTFMPRMSFCTMEVTDSPFPSATARRRQKAEIHDFSGTFFENRPHEWSALLLFCATVFGFVVPKGTRTGPEMQGCRSRQDAGLALASLISRGG